MTKAQAKRRTRASRALKSPTTVSKLPQGDVEIAVHELPTVQAELKMQNEALRRRQLELAKLQESQEQLQALFDHTPEGIVFVDRQTRKLIRGNAAFAQMLGYPMAEIPGLRVADLHPAGSLPHVLAQFERMARREIPVAEDLLVRRQDGSVFLAEVRSFPITIAGTVQLAASFRDLTERQQAAAQLAAAVRELQDVKVAFDQHAIVAITDAQGKITYANDKFCAISKYSRAELLGQDHRILNSGYHPKEFIHRLWTTIGQGQIWKGEIKNRAKDGTYYWVDTTIVPFLSPDGKPYQYIAIRTDITERRHAQAVLRESEEQFRTLFQSAPIGIALQDASGRFLNTNRTYQEMLGYSGAELKRLGTRRITYPEDVPEERQLVAALSAGTRDAYQFEHRYWGRKRRLVWARASASAVRDHLGQLRFIITMVEDITGRKQAEDQIRLLVNSVHSTQELICITDQKNRFQFVNRAFLSAYGYTEPELLGRKPDLLSAPANAPELYDQIYQQTLGGGWQGEIVNRRKDGTEFPIALNTSQITDGAGRILGLVGVARDISAQKRAEKESAAFALLGHRLSGATTLAQAADIILEIASALFGWDAAYVDLYSPEEDKIIPVLTMDTLDGRRTAIPASTLKLEPSPLMRAIMKDGWRLINRTRKARATVALAPFGDTQRRSASMMYVPINASDSVLGILSIQSYTPRAYSERDLQLLQTLADHCGEALLRIEVTEARHAAEVKYQGIFEQATEGIVQTTPDGRYLGANPAAARMLGYATPDELMASTVGSGRQTYVRPEKWKELEHRMETQGAVENFEVERYRKDGSKFWMNINRHVVRDASGAILYHEGTNQDITGRKEAEEELRRLPQRIIAAQEAERLRVARELHDGVNQLLASAKMRLGKVEAGLRASAPAAREILRRCSQLLVQALEENRRIAHDLRPSDLDALGLAAAGRNLCAEFQSRAALRVQSHFPREWQRLPPAVELNLFRILQEALTNVEKYAQAKTVRVRLGVEAAVVGLRIRDDGRGFDPNVAPPAKKGRRGIGLKNMRERAVAIGGTCDLVSVPKQGTTITVRVPLPKAK